jgi:hypothetical protein
MRRYALFMCLLFFFATFALYCLALGGKDPFLVPGEVVLQPLGSPVFDTIRYHQSSGTMTVVFRDGDTYEYSGVPRGCFNGMFYTQCRGEYFNRRIRGQFPYRRIDAD